MSYESMKKEWAERRKRIIAMAERKGPGSYHVVGRTFKISRQRVQQIVSTYGKRNGS